MECVACTQCVDACDSIMDKVDLPRGLIRYTSERALDGERTRALRPRTAVYGLLLVAVATVFTVALTTRHAYDVNVGRSVGQPFTELPDGTVANRVYVSVRNQTGAAATFRLDAPAPAGADVRVGGVQPVRVGSHQRARIDAFVVVPRAAFADAAQVETTLRLTFSDGTAETIPFTLLGPSR